MSLPATLSFSVAVPGTWTQQVPSAGINVESNAGLGRASGAGTGAIFYNGDPVADRQYARCKFVDATVGSSANCVTVRAKETGANCDFYDFYSDGTTGAGHSAIEKCVNNTFTDLKVLSLTLTGGDLMQLDADGTLLTVRKNGVAFDSVSDAALVSGSGGCAISGGAAGAAHLDDVEVGELASYPDFTRFPIAKLAQSVRRGQAAEY